MTPRCTLFAQSKLSLFEVYTISFTLINHSSSQQVVRIEPIPSVEDVHFSITVSDQGGPHDSGSRLEVVIKRGKSAVVDVSIQFTQVGVSGFSHLSAPPSCRKSSCFRPTRRAISCTFRPRRRRRCSASTRCSSPR